MNKSQRDPKYIAKAMSMKAKHNFHSHQCRVLLNLRTSQPFEEVLEDLGQVLKMPGAKRMYTSTGDEVRSFSQLRNEFADIETFYLDSTTSAIAPIPIGSPIRRSRSRNNIATSTATAAATAIGILFLEL